MGCQKIIVTNACGHSMAVSYAFCGGNHLNNPDTNRACYDITRPIVSLKKIVRYAIGREFCGPACRALHQGWYCCTCNHLPVRGYLDQDNRMVVHQTCLGAVHALCTACLM